MGDGVEDFSGRAGCRPYRAQTKGKIESGVKYVRRTFYATCWVGSRAVWGISMPNCAAGSPEVANQRVHAGVRIGPDQKLKGLWILLLGCSDDSLDHHY